MTGEKSGKYLLIYYLLGFYQDVGFKIGFGQCTGTIIPTLPSPK
jgi:hypothetical protein